MSEEITQAETDRLNKEASEKLKAEKAMQAAEEKALKEAQALKAKEEKRKLKEAEEEAKRLTKENEELKALQAAVDNKLKEQVEKEAKIAKDKLKKFKLSDRPDGVSFHDYVMSDPNLPSIIWVKIKDVEFIFHQARSAFAAANPYRLKRNEYTAIKIKEDIAFFILKTLQGGNSKIIVRKVKPNEVVAAEKIQSDHAKKLRQDKIKEIDIQM